MLWGRDRVRLEGGCFAHKGLFTLGFEGEVEVIRSVKSIGNVYAMFPIALEL
jgi:hypothetical protein